MTAARTKKITGFSLKSRRALAETWQTYYLSMPRYFAVFFNPAESEVLAEKEVRQALNYGTSKKEIVQAILAASSQEEGSIVHSPVLPEIYGFEQPSTIYEFDVEKAKAILEEAGFKDKEGKGLRTKYVSKEPAFEFERDLKTGSEGKEVEELQKCLARFSEIYPEGEVTGYFGEKTKAAVIRFQEKHSADILDPWGFTEGTGIVSRTTRGGIKFGLHRKF